MLDETKVYNQNELIGDMKALLIALLVSISIDNPLTHDISSTDKDRIRTFAPKLLSDVKEEFPEFEGLSYILRTYIGITGSAMYNMIDEANRDELLFITDKDEYGEEPSYNDPYLWELMSEWAECNINVYLKSISNELKDEWVQVFIFLEDWILDNTKYREDTPCFQHMIAGIWGLEETE